jgi:tRNA1Val (adenine37-N6)-methyltransferase
MKVCTDACVLGAVADVGSPSANDSIRILDIGTGTGLLALMAAQRNPTATIDAVELDPDAAQQARENVADSPFAGRVMVWQSRIQDYQAAVYDRILTNPPFYANHLRSPDAATNRAHHADELPFDALVLAVSRLLATDGQWWVLLPPAQMRQLTRLAAEAGLFPTWQLNMRHHVQKPVFRQIIGFVRGTKNILTNSELDIYEPSGGAYTADFRALMGDFYLIF